MLASTFYQGLSIHILVHAVRKHHIDCTIGSKPYVLTVLEAVS